LRLITSIPHPQMRITVYLWNGKYLVKCEAGPYEQSYKFDETLIEQQSEVEKLLTDDFLNSVVERFKVMHNEFTQLFIK
jgi:hypothetical protein